VLAPKTDAISRLRLVFRQYRLSFYPTDLKPGISNLEVGIKKISLGVMTEAKFFIYMEDRVVFRLLVLTWFTKKCNVF
jgi:hypothetical protein